jgi:hypothetical protein
MIMVKIIITTINPDGLTPNLFLAAPLLPPPAPPSPKGLSLASTERARFATSRHVLCKTPDTRSRIDSNCCIAHQRASGGGRWWVILMMRMTTTMMMMMIMIIVKSHLGGLYASGALALDELVGLEGLEREVEQLHVLDLQQLLLELQQRAAERLLGQKQLRLQLATLRGRGQGEGEGER